MSPYYVQLGTCLFRNILVNVTKKARPLLIDIVSGNVIKTYIGWHN